MDENKYLHNGEEIQILDNMEISAKNYPTLIEAMGMDKYRAMTYGEGLKGIPQLQKDLTEHGFKKAKYSIGTFKNQNGNEETSLFVEQILAESRVIFEVEPRSEKQLLLNFLRVKHLYIVGKDGVTADLVEELGIDGSMMITPEMSFGFSHFDPKRNRVHLGDLSIEDIDFPNAGLPIILHEIGHLKHMQIESGIYVDIKNNIVRMLGRLRLTRTELEKAVKTQNIHILKPLLRLFEESGINILKTERIASLWASRWIEQKRLEAADFWKPESDDFWDQLNFTLASYQTILLLEDEY